MTPNFKTLEKYAHEEVAVSYDANSSEAVRQKY